MNTLRPDKKLEQDAAERVEVRRAAHVVHLVLDLLGRHVARRAGAGVGRELQRLGAVEPLVVRILLEPRQTEIQNVDLRADRPAISSTSTFEGLRSPWMMPRACAWASAPRIWSTTCQISAKRFGTCERSWSETPVARSIDQVRRAVAELTEVPRAHDARVIQRRERARLLVEPDDVLGGELALRRNDALERDVADRCPGRDSGRRSPCRLRRARSRPRSARRARGREDGARCSEGGELLRAHAQYRAFLQRRRRRNAGRGAVGVRLGFDGGGAPDK